MILNGSCPPSKKILFSYQIAFWKKDIFESIILGHENPWLSEWYGDSRCEKMRVRIESLKTDVPRPIPYDLRGCLHQGRWLENAVDFLNQQKINFDFQKRGFYSENEIYKTLRFRIKFKIEMIICGLKGSYLDLFFRRPIH